jgi:REP element-mobilizing transposase RayT
MATRVLIINRQLAFSVALKQALERTGGFVVHPFTTSDAAIEYIQTHPMDVALIDFSSVTPSGATVVETLRRIQPSLPIVVSPEQPAEMMNRLSLQGSIDPPFNARDVMPLLNSAAGGEAVSDLRKLPTRPVGMPTPDTPASNTPPRQADATQEGRKLRPGEIDESQLRPYMYSTDLFKKRTTTEGLGAMEGLPTPAAPPPVRPGEFTGSDLAGPSTDVFRQQSGRLRPGEIDPSELQSSTDVFKSPSAPPEENRSYRPGELGTEDLSAPSTDVFRSGASEAISGTLPPLERPDRRRTGSFPSAAEPPPPQPAAPRNARPGEYSDQDLLNLALNRGFIAADGTPPPSTAQSSARGETLRPGEIDTGGDGEYRISTDVFKEQEDEVLSLSPEDAAAMWEQLTREDTPVQPMEMLRGDQMAPPPLSVDGDFAFDFDDPGETPSGVQPQLSRIPSITEMFIDSTEDAVIPEDLLPGEQEVRPRSVTDLLISKAQDVVLPPDEPEAFPQETISKTDVLLAAAEELDMPITTSPIGLADAPLVDDYNWDFPDDEPRSVTTGTLTNSRRTTERFPAIHQSDEIEAVDAARLDEQYAFEELSGITDEYNAAYDGEAEQAPPRGRGMTDEINDAYRMPYDDNLRTNPPGTDDEEIVYEELDDAFEPPISAEQLITSYLNAELATFDEPESPEEMASISYEEDAGVRRLEEIANEIRRTRETNKLVQSEPEAKAQIDEVFDRLAAEEPPMPADDDGGTVGDLYTVVSDPEFQGVLKLLRSDVPPPEAAPPVVQPLNADGKSTISQSEIADIFASYGREVPAFTEFDFAEPQEASSAHVILETALTKDSPTDEFSLPILIANIERQLEKNKSSIKPLPSWVKDKHLRDDLYIREPDFLPEVIANLGGDALPQLDEDEQDLSDATTYAGAMPTQVGDMETEWLPAVTTRPSRLPEQEWDIPEPPIADDDTSGGTKPFEVASLPLLADDEDEPEFNTEFERLAAFEFPEPEDEEQHTPPMGIEAIQDPYIAQIALSLTQVSLDDIAGIVLTRENEIMANAGRMSRDEVMEIDASMGGMWDNDGDQYNIRFITLSSSAKDYMVYSKRTVNDLTLSVVFPGATSIKSIRAQAKRLLDALVMVPEPLDESTTFASEAPPSSDVRSMYTYVWLLREPESRFSDMVARAIETSMRRDLEARTWEVVNLRVQDEFVYVVADVPGETPPFEVVRDLKRRAHEIARKQNPSLGKTDLWADGYLVVAPGRELEEDEIQQFIQFERMAT